MFSIPTFAPKQTSLGQCGAFRTSGTLTQPLNILLVPGRQVGECLIDLATRHLTPTGFFRLQSKVRQGDPSGATLLVRARRRGDIEAVFATAEVIEGGGTDYQYRARIDREKVAQAMADQVRGVTYTNFKGTVKNDDRHDAYMDVWSAMMRFQESRRRR